MKTEQLSTLVAEHPEIAAAFPDWEHCPSRRAIYCQSVLASDAGQRLRRRPNRTVLNDVAMDEASEHGIRDYTYVRVPWPAPSSGTFRLLLLPESKNPAAVALGKVKSDKKAAAARENGKKGGRPKKPKLPA